MQDGDGEARGGEGRFCGFLLRGRREEGDGVLGFEGDTAFFAGFAIMEDKRVFDKA